MKIKNNKNKIFLYLKNNLFWNNFRVIIILNLIFKVKNNFKLNISILKKSLK